MNEHVGLFINIWIKFFFLTTPFFALSMFLSLTKGATPSERRKLALQITGTVAAFAVGMFFFGTLVFKLFGITLDAFRVGGGALLFISAVQLLQPHPTPSASSQDDDIVVVPMSMPIILGPATIGALMVFGADLSGSTEKTIGCFALLTAIASLGIILLLAASIERFMKKKQLRILSKITGLILAAIAAQMILTGVKNCIQLP